MTKGGSREASPRTPGTGTENGSEVSGVPGVRKFPRVSAIWRPAVTTGVFSDLASSAVYEAMQGLWAEQQAVANNVANVNTPGYKAQDVNFESSLAQAVSNGDPTQMQITTSTSDAPGDQTGNNVSLSSEMVEEEKAGMQFQTMVDAMNAKFQLLSVAINGPSSNA